MKCTDQRISGQTSVIKANKSELKWFLQVTAKPLQNTHEKAQLGELEILSSWAQCKHSTAFGFNKIKEISKSHKTKHQDKFHKYEKLKSN